MDFDRVHEQSAAAASRVVNLSLTLRNWLTGHYIVEYEQHGADRAKYGEGLLEKLARALADRGIVEISARSLRLYRQFFLAYPGIWQSAIAKSAGNVVPSLTLLPVRAAEQRRHGREFGEDCRTRVLLFSAML